MTAELRFKAAVQALIVFGVHPTPTLLRRCLGQLNSSQMNNLNGRECGWLRRDMRVGAIKKGYPYSKPCIWACCVAGGPVPEVL